MARLCVEWQGQMLMVHPKEGLTLVMCLTREEARELRDKLIQSLDSAPMDEKESGVG